MALTWLRLLPGIIILALVMVVIGQRVDNNRLRELLSMERAARSADRQLYKSAQDFAAEKNKADLARIQQKQKEISDNAENSYNRDLAELRRLRSQAPRRAPGKPGVSQVPEAPGGPPENGLPLSADQYLRAQEIELRLMHLQNWIEEQTR